MLDENSLFSRNLSHFPESNTVYKSKMTLFVSYGDHKPGWKMSGKFRDEWEKQKYFDRRQLQRAQTLTF